MSFQSITSENSVLARMGITSEQFISEFTGGDFYIEPVDSVNYFFHGKIGEIKIESGRIILHLLDSVVQKEDLTRKRVGCVDMFDVTDMIKGGSYRVSEIRNFYGNRGSLDAVVLIPATEANKRPFNYDDYCQRQ